MTTVLYVKSKIKERKAAATRSPHSPAPISCSYFNWKMLVLELAVLGVVGFRCHVACQFVQFIECVASNNRLARPRNNPQLPRQFVGGETVLQDELEGPLQRCVDPIDGERLGIEGAPPDEYVFRVGQRFQAVRIAADAARIERFCLRQ